MKMALSATGVNGNAEPDACTQNWVAFTQKSNDEKRTSAILHHEFKEEECYSPEHYALGNELKVCLSIDKPNGELGIRGNCEKSQEACINVPKQTVRNIENRTASRNPQPRLQIRKVPPDLGKRFQCVECGFRFKYQCNLRRHAITHTGKKPYKCDECGGTFATKSYVRNHARIHTGQKPYKCEQCGAAFTQTSHLKNHMLIHSRQRPYKCTDCGVAFTQKIHLKDHMLIHTGQKPHVCGECGDSFRHMRSLNIHKLQHKGEKPYKCELCPAAFADKGYLNVHRRVHTKVKANKSKLEIM